MRVKRHYGLESETGVVGQVDYLEFGIKVD